MGTRSQKIRLIALLRQFSRPDFSGNLYRANFGSTMNAMKSFLIVFLLSGFIPEAVHAQNQSLTIVIKNVKNGAGNVAAALYHSEDEFMKKTWQSRSAPSQPGEMHFVFENVPAGDYAVSVMHDANKNGEVDKNFMGIPKEGFGFSNDALGKFGPPAFKDAKFVIPDKNELVITLKYY
jgi:uncharacterized protein (DUF2141 family)